jgi:DNA repair protein RecN (Recombination protein N)
LELATFQLAELDKAAPRAGEDEELEGLKKVLASAERVERLCEESYGLLYEQDGAVLASLGSVWRRVGELAALDPGFQPYLDAKDGIKSQLDDLALHLRRYADNIEASPARLQQVEDRLALLERLKRKHGPTLSDVLTRRDVLRSEVDELEQGSDRLAAQEEAQRQAAASYLRLASSLSDSRRKAARQFSRAMEKLLADLAMEQTRFEVRFTDRLLEPEWTADGIEAGEFFLSPNPGEEVRPLARIVSGGELSRVMLALKTLTATRRFGFTDESSRSPSAAAPGLIFDEVDAGIGGRVADVVGARLRTLGSAFHVLCITHLPQIAAYADSHYLIEKRVEQGRTVTSVQKLDRQGRVAELTRMLGGATMTPQLRASAEEMLDKRADIPQGNEAKAKGKSTQGESESRLSAKAKPAGRGTKRPEA